MSAFSTVPVDDPFLPYLEKVSSLRSSFDSGSLRAHHALLDALRVCEDVLLAATLTFLQQPQPSALCASSFTIAQTASLERLRDGEVVDTHANKQIVQLRNDALWCMGSSAREITREKATDAINFVQQLATHWHECIERAKAHQPKPGCPDGHVCCRDLEPIHFSVIDITAAGGSAAASAATHDKKKEKGDEDVAATQPLSILKNPAARLPLAPRPRAHAALPYGWSASDLAEHCKPLHNTTSLDLAALEEEEEQREAELLAQREAERQARVQARLDAADRRRARIEAEEAARAERGRADADLSDLEENEEEVDSEEERATARREARREAGEVETPPQSEPEGAADDKEPEEETAEPPAQQPKERYSFTFCCIVCHNILLRARDIERVSSNQVWSKSGKNLKSVVRNYADEWQQRPADESGVQQTIDEEEEEPEPDDEEVNNNEPKDEGASKRESSIGVHCAGCDYYVGRFFPLRDAFRLVYISRATGQNFMYYTGDTEKLAPLLVRRDEEEEEEEEEPLSDEDEDSESFLERKRVKAEAKLNAPIPPIVGVPGEYESVAQSRLYPFPRFGPQCPYGNDSAWLSFHEQVNSEERSKLMAVQTAQGKQEKKREEEKENSLLTSSRALSATTSLISSKKSPINNKNFKPVLPPVPLIRSMLQRHPDTIYELGVNAHSLQKQQEVITDLSMLLWSDRIFHNRRAMDKVSDRIVNLFANFPSGVYSSTVTPPVPIFTHFFVQSPDFTHCRGTARYVFHFLSQKDDSKIKRQQYSYKKFLKSLQRWENAVFHMTAGGYGGHRFVIVKIGGAYRIFQSNYCLYNARDRYTLLQWLSSCLPWSRVLDEQGLLLFLHKFEAARRGRQEVWQQLFTCGRAVQTVFDHADEWKPDQVYYSMAKLQDFALQY